MSSDSIPVPLDVLRTLDFLVEEHRKAYVNWQAVKAATADGRSGKIRDAWTKVEHAADAANRALRDLLTVYRVAVNLPLPSPATLTDPGTSIPILTESATGA